MPRGHETFRRAPGLVLLGEREPLAMVDEFRDFRRALLLSVLAHLLLVAVFLLRAYGLEPGSDPLQAELEPQVPVEAPVPVNLGAAPPPAGVVTVPRKPPDPREFELYQLPEPPEEKPRSERAPLSDRDRRAHGGEGEPANTPGVHGTSSQLVQATGGDRLGQGTPGGQAGASVGGPRAAETPQEAEERRRAAGLGEEQPPPLRQPAHLLPPSGAWAAVPGPGDLAGGEGGLAESPDRPGGHVDAGGLSFDTQWYDFGPYAKRMLAKIRRNWRIPEIALLGVQGVVRIRFLIERDGRVTGLQILNESGKPPMDFAARDAIGDSSPFDPLPTDLTGVDREGVTITFYYNCRPPNWNGED